MALVTSVTLEIMRSLKSFAGIIIIIYYVFAILGMMLFEKSIDPPGKMSLMLLFDFQSTLNCVFHRRNHKFRSRDKAAEFRFW